MKLFHFDEDLGLILRWTEVLWVIVSESGLGGGHLIKAIMYCFSSERSETQGVYPVGRIQFSSKPFL
jgi:hypothetical protein